MTSDELEGKALAEAVALAQGWEMYGTHWVVLLSGEHVWQQDIEDYRPDIGINQAFVLIDKLWEQRCDFCISREDQDRWWVEIHDLKWCNEETNSYTILVSEMLRGTAPEVICRAFLKAKTAR